MNPRTLQVGVRYQGTGADRTITAIEPDPRLLSGTRVHYEAHTKRPTRRPRSCCLHRFASWAKQDGSGHG